MGLRGIENGVTRFHQVRGAGRETSSVASADGFKIALRTLKHRAGLSLPAIVHRVRQVRAQGLPGQWSRERVQGVPSGSASTEAVGGEDRLHRGDERSLSKPCSTSPRTWPTRGRNDIRIEAALAKLWCRRDGLARGRTSSSRSAAVAGSRPPNRSPRGENARDPGPSMMLRDLRINRIFEGSTEIMHLLIAREAVDAHLSVAGDIIDPEAELQARRRPRAAGGAFYGAVAAAAGRRRRQLPVVVRRVRPAGARTAVRGARLAPARALDVLRDGALAGRSGAPAGFLARVVDIGAELFAISAAVVRAELIRSGGVPRRRHAAPDGDSAYELADSVRAPVAAAGRPAVRRARGTTPTAATCRSPKDVLEDRYTWARGRHRRPGAGGPLDRGRVAGSRHGRERGAPFLPSTRGEV
jgi:hypothetical protein